MSEPISASQDSSSGKKRQPQSDDVKSAFKKRGHFDALRKELFRRLLESPAHSQLQESIKSLAMAELSQDRALRARDRGKAASLLEGVMERGEIYEDVEKYFDASLGAERKRIEKLVREVYRELGGDLNDDDEEEEEDEEMQDQERAGDKESLGRNSSEQKDVESTPRGLPKEDSPHNGEGAKSPRDTEMKDSDTAMTNGV